MDIYRPVDYPLGDGVSLVKYHWRPSGLPSRQSQAEASKPQVAGAAWLGLALVFPLAAALKTGVLPQVVNKSGGSFLQQQVEEPRDYKRVPITANKTLMVFAPKKGSYGSLKIAFWEPTIIHGISWISSQLAFSQNCAD